MILDRDVADRLKARLREIYGPAGDTSLPALLELLNQYADLQPERPQDRRAKGNTPASPPRSPVAKQQHAQKARMSQLETERLPPTWDQRDVILITYGDQVQRNGQAPLATLNEFLTADGLDRLIDSLHILPFCPYTSDDGFSVVDYRAVDPDLGSWSDIHRLGESYDLVFDLVLNHVSQQSDWFRQYLAGNPEYLDYFIEVDPSVDLSGVTRPRSLPLLTPFQTSRGERHLWTTFSADQIDLNYSNPKVLLAMLDVLLFYVRQGARLIRLDAVAYLWKELGTSCIHLPQTYAIVKLMRDVLDLVAPHVLLVTETNVPHAENISYFGNGDQAHMVYQFSLPPLLFDAMIQQDATPFNTWLSGLGTTPPRTTFFNFTASHDGIGVRPLEGIVSPDRLKQLVTETRRRGGLVSTRRTPTGEDIPYELNISYVDALSNPNSDDVNEHSRRFLTSQAVMLAFRGIPGVYFHSLVGTRNDVEGAKESGIARRINRHKFSIDELNAALADEASLQAVIHRGYRHLLDVRIQQPAFHPDAAQAVWTGATQSLLAFVRTSPDDRQKILVVANVTDQPQLVDLTRESEWHLGRDLLSGQAVTDQQFLLAPSQVCWLEAHSMEQTSVQQQTN